MEQALDLTLLPRRPKRLGIFERYLSLWVGICMVIGVIIGQAAPDSSRRCAAQSSDAGARLISLSRF